MEFTLIFLLRKFNNLNQKTRYIHINNIKIKSFNQRNFLQQQIFLIIFLINIKIV